MCSEMPNVFLLVTVGRQAGSATAAPPLLLRPACPVQDHEDTSHLRSPRDCQVAAWSGPCPTPPSLLTARALALPADSVRLAGDHQYGCASWSEETTTNWNGSKPQAMPLFFTSPTALCSSMASCEVWSHQTPRQKRRSN